MQRKTQHTHLESSSAIIIHHPSYIIVHHRTSSIIHTSSTIHHLATAERISYIYTQTLIPDSSKMFISNGSKKPERFTPLVSTHNTAPAKDHDDFVKLPAEIQVLVMMLVPDLPALQHLISASHTLNAMFDQNHIKIANAIMSRLTLELRQIMRAVAFALTESTDAPLIDGEVFHNMGSSKEEQFRDVDEKFGIPTLPSTLPLSTTRRLLLVSCRIQRVSNHFITTQFARLNRIEVAHLLIENQSDGLYGFLDYTRTAVPYTPKDSGPARWIERYWVECTLWRLQLLAIFGVHHGRVRCSDARSIAKQATTTSSTFLGMQKVLLLGEKDQMDGMWEYMNEEQLSMRETSLKSLEVEYLHSDIDFPASARLPLLDEIPTDELARAWEQDRPAARRQTRARSYLDSNMTGLDGSPPCVDWEPFRRLGFGFWDWRRVCDMELLTNQYSEHVWSYFPRGSTLRDGVGIRMSPRNCLFTWMSIKLDGEKIVGDRPFPR